MTSLSRTVVWAAVMVSGAILLCLANAQTVQPPAILFTDLVSGPATGNSDSSQPGQSAGQDGAIVTVWGKYLGATPGTITVGGIPARIYSWGNATEPADLYTRDKMQMVSFQIPHNVSAGATTIQATVNGISSNTLPFSVRAGKIYFVKTGDDSGNGSWKRPWRNLYDNTTKLQPGDTVYILDGYTQTGRHDGGGCSAPGCTMSLEYGENPSQFATQAMPKAVIGYPGAAVQIGDTTVGSWGIYNGSGNPSAAYWTFSKLTLLGAGYSMGHRLIGNLISCPNGDGPTGCIAGDDSTNLYVLGNELTNCGYAGTSKLFHPMYIQSLESSRAPRLPDEPNREIAWNYLHDNYAYDGINIYREGAYSAFMLNTRVHDNFIVNQTGRGILIGSYVVGPDNYIYNNVIINAGQGPVSKYTSDPAFGYFCVQFSAGWSAYQGTTTIHFYNNSMYNCGFTDPANNIVGAMIAIDTSNPFNLDFRNNIVRATGWPYLASYSSFATGTVTNNIWHGKGAAPSRDLVPINSDPKFISPASPCGDLHLQAGSPAIGAGSSASPPAAADFDNVLRSGPPAIGAFEFSGTNWSAPRTAPNEPAGSLHGRKPRCDIGAYQFVGRQ